MVNPFAVTGEPVTKLSNTALFGLFVAVHREKRFVQPPKQEEIVDLLDSSESKIRSDGFEKQKPETIPFPVGTSILAYVMGVVCMLAIFAALFALLSTYGIPAAIFTWAAQLITAHIVTVSVLQLQYIALAVALTAVTMETMLGIFAFRFNIPIVRWPIVEPLNYYGKHPNSAAHAHAFFHGMEVALICVPFAPFYSFFVAHAVIDLVMYLPLLVVGVSQWFALKIVQTVGTPFLNAILDPWLKDGTDVGKQDQYPENLLGGECQDKGKNKKP